MSNSEDVTALFRRFGGSADTYQEIVSKDQAGTAEQKWPMLNQIRPSGHREAPSVRGGGGQHHGNERARQEFQEPYRAPPPVPVSAEVMIARPAVVPAVVQPVVMDAPQVMPVVVAQHAARIDPLPAPPVHAEPVQAPAPAVSPLAEGSLQSMFGRMVATQPDKVTTPDTNPLKRLVKW